MVVPLTIAINPVDINNEQKLYAIVANKLSLPIKRIAYIQVIKRSIDARNKDVKYVLQLNVFIDKYVENINKQPVFSPLPLKNKKVIIVGFGPAGIFAALTLLQNGIEPIIFERGKNVHERKRDIAQMYRNNIVNEESNYCFGEGGAGTFSDGKLYTRSTKKGNIGWFLQVLVAAGAREDIIINAHPHIGSDKLPAIIENIRNWIIEAGGEIHFNCKVTDLIIVNNECKGVIINNETNVQSDAVILATGHSAKDIYRLLISKNIIIEPKGFAMGVRIEHPQSIINKIQYHNSKLIKYLPNAEYKITENINNKGVYSFCMCPGGIVVPAMTEKNTIVVNGMSASHRNSPYANSGFVVEISPEDISAIPSPIEMISYQQKIEKMAYEAVRYGMKAPAQRIKDFILNKYSSYLPDSSYIPGIYSSPMHEWLPDIIKNYLKQAFIKLQKKIPGFIYDDAILIGVESRTSSPVRIVRNKNTYEHITIKKLYPCGEGAGYAGGITSSAFDGINVANAIAEKLK